MHDDEQETIFAVATAAGKAGVAIVRLSGPSALSVAQNLSGELPEPRYLSLREFRDGDEWLDEGLITWFEKGKSFTGDTVVEFHLHGGTAVLNRFLKCLAGKSGLRLAEPGEFTRRAFYAGRLDLTEVEALADLIDAETELQRNQASDLLSGALSLELHSVRSDILSALALLEASIDFADEDDAPVDVSEDCRRIVTSALAVLSKLAEGSVAAERIREGFRVALVGPPNVGKSTLLNALVGRSAAITSPLAGTTRDAIEVRCDIGGFPVTFVDLAGLRVTDDEIEAIGVERALAEIKTSDLRLILMSGDTPPAMDFHRGPQDIIVWTKADVSSGPADVVVSAETELGLSDLVDRIGSVLGEMTAGSRLVTNERQRRHILSARDEVDFALQVGAVELQSEHLRAALAELGFLFGKYDVEDVLDEIFARFCLGK